MIDYFYNLNQRTLFSRELITHTYRLTANKYLIIHEHVHK